MSTVRCNFHNFFRRRLPGHKIYKDLYGQGFQFQVEKALVGTFCEILLTLDTLKDKSLTSIWFTDELSIRWDLIHDVHLNV